MRINLIAGAFLLAAGCASVDYSDAKPGVIAKSDREARPVISALLSEILNRRYVQLTRDVLTKESRLIIEPKAEGFDPYGNPASGRLLGRPDHFTLLAVNGACVLRHEKTGEYYPVEGLKCKPL